MKKAAELITDTDEIGIQIIQFEFQNTVKRLLAALVPVDGCTDRYIIYSEKDNTVIVASVDPKKPNGAFMMVKVLATEFKRSDTWKMPPLVVLALRDYLSKFVTNIKKINHADF
jgi:hypothetical protein